MDLRHNRCVELCNILDKTFIPLVPTLNLGCESCNLRSNDCSESIDQRATLSDGMLLSGTDDMSFVSVAWQEHIAGCNTRGTMPLTSTLGQYLI